MTIILTTCPFSPEVPLFASLSKYPHLPAVVTPEAVAFKQLDILSLQVL